MSRPVVVLPDVELALVTLVRTILTGRPEVVVDGCKVSPSGDGAKPKIQVVRIGGSAATPAHDLPTVDFRIWHTRSDWAMELARIVSAELRSVEGAVAGTSRVTFADELTGPTRTIDPVDDTTPQVFFRHQFFIR